MKNLNNLEFVLYSFFILFNNLYLFAQNKLYNKSHDAPWNFDLKKFYDLLLSEYGITIIQGVDGMTLERFKEPSKPENKIHWPLVLKGPKV